MKRERRREHNPVSASSGRGKRNADLLAPPEERKDLSAGKNSNNNGVLVVDTGELKLPGDFTEKEDKKSRFMGLEPVALVILIFALAFIAFITYLISTEPPR